MAGNPKDRFSRIAAHIYEKVNRECGGLVLDYRTSEQQVHYLCCVVSLTKTHLALHSTGQYHESYGRVVSVEPSCENNNNVVSDQV